MVGTGYLAGYVHAADHDARLALRVLLEGRDGRVRHRGLQRFHVGAQRVVKCRFTETFF
jgi:hypothetical protein